jgi:hypothetical protein
MFAGLRGTSIAMLGVDKGVLVAADRRMGDTLSSAFSDDATKLLPIHPYGLVTGWGMAALRDHKTGEVRVDIMKMMKRMCRYPQFQFRPDDYKAVALAWNDMMLNLIHSCGPKDWPPTPDCGYWFKAMFVFQKAVRVEAWILNFAYQYALPHPTLNGGFDSVQDKYVNCGHLLMEGDQRGGEYLEKESADSPLLAETHKAWKTGLNPAEISVERGARIVKDALYMNHLYSTKPDGEKGVGPTCDIAFIDRQVGFRWCQQNVSTVPDSVS